MDEENFIALNGAKINAAGEIINAETGEVVGNGTLRSGITIDSSGAEPKTIEEMGYSPLTETEEEYKEAMRRQGLPVMRSSWEIMYEHEHQGRNAIDDFIERNKPVSVKEAKRQADNARKSKYEVRPDTSFVIRFGIMEDDNGRFSAVPAGRSQDSPNVEAHWVKFRMWTYEEKLKWKSEFMEVNGLRRPEVNVEKMNERKIRSLLLDWSFGLYGDDMKLLHCDGALSNESYSLFLNMHPSIANAIVDMMNQVLDNG